MRLFRFARRHPLALLGVIAIAFVTWIWWDALPKRQDDPTAADVQPTGPMRRTLPRPASIDVAVDLPLDAAPVLAKLKPGMPRAEVEKLVGVPAAHNVSPATVVDGRVTYHTAYEADFGPAPTIRPIHPGPRLPPPAAASDSDPTRTLVTLEYDATKPGHPLVRIHYADPLF